MWLLARGGDWRSRKFKVGDAWDFWDFLELGTSITTCHFLTDCQCVPGVSVTQASLTMLDVGVMMWNLGWGWLSAVASSCVPMEFEVGGPGNWSLWPGEFQEFPISGTSIIRRRTIPTNEKRLSTLSVARNTLWGRENTSYERDHWFNRSRQCLASLV